MKQFVSINSRYDMPLSHEAIMLLNTCVNVGLKFSEKEGVELEMCKGIEEWIVEEREEGREEGMAAAMINMIEGFANRNGMSIEEALDMHGIPAEEYEAAKALIVK